MFGLNTARSIRDPFSQQAPFVKKNLFKDFFQAVTSPVRFTFNIAHKIDDTLQKVAKIPVVGEFAQIAMSSPFYSLPKAAIKEAEDVTNLAQRAMGVLGSVFNSGNQIHQHLSHRVVSSTAVPPKPDHTIGPRILPAVIPTINNKRAKMTSSS